MTRDRETPSSSSSSTLTGGQLKISIAIGEANVAFRAAEAIATGQYSGESCEVIALRTPASQAKRAEIDVAV